MTKNEDYRKEHIDYRKVANYEYKLYSQDTYDSYIWEMEKKILYNEIKQFNKKNSVYLDFACGTGRIISFLERYFLKSIGVDISRNMLTLAKEKIEDSLLVECDISSKDVLGNMRFDLITAFRFFLNAQKDLRERIMLLLSEKLSEDGLLIFNIHGNSMSYYFYPYLLSKLKIKKESLKALSLFETRELLKKSKLKIVKIYGIGFLPSFLYKLINIKYLLIFEKKISKVNCLKFFARNLIFVCTKK